MDTFWDAFCHETPVPLLGCSPIYFRVQNLPSVMCSSLGRKLITTNTLSLPMFFSFFSWKISNIDNKRIVHNTNTRVPTTQFQLIFCQSYFIYSQPLIVSFRESCKHQTLYHFTTVSLNFSSFLSLCLMMQWPWEAGETCCWYPPVDGGGVVHTGIRLHGSRIN